MPDDLPVSPPTPSADVSSVPSTPTDNPSPTVGNTPAPPLPVEPAVTIPVPAKPEPVLTNEPSIIPPAQPESVPTPLPENPPPPASEKSKRKGISGTLVASLLLLLIVLPISAYFVSKNENIMNNLPFALEVSRKEAKQEAADAARKALERASSAAPAQSPKDSGITHQCNGTAQTIPYFASGNCAGSQDCTGSPYIYHVHADKTSNLKLTYVTASTHCSNVSVLFKVDGTLKYTTGYISGSVSTGAIDLGNVEAGDHTVSLGAIGQTGGCNYGALVTWGGSITTTCGEAVVTGTPTVTATPQPTSPPSAPGVCDASCDNDSGCQSGFVCVSVDGIKRCRKPECSSYANCVCPAATATPIPTTVRVIVTATPTPIVVTATPAPTIIAAAPIPKTPVSGVPSVLGAATIGGGILLLLLGLFL